MNNRVIFSIRIALEMFLISKNNFKLDGKNYELLLFVPTDRYDPQTKYKIYISSTVFQGNSIDIVNELLAFSREHLNNREYVYISHLEVFPVNHPIVRNLNFITPSRNDIMELGEMVLGGTTIPNSFICYSHRLANIKKNRAVHLTTVNSQSIPAGIVSIDQNFLIQYYTAKALNIIREESNAGQIANEKIVNLTLEEKVKLGYIQFIKYSDIISCT